jgi:hypothetical protein
VADQSNAVKINQTALDQAHADMAPLERELKELRQAAKGQVPSPLSH